MSFTKRTLTYSNIRSVFESSGYKSLKLYMLKPDALFVHDAESADLLEILQSDKSDLDKEKLIKSFLNSN